MSHRPTDEQAAVVAASTTGEHLVVEAGAGTGKTSTLKLLARANPRRRGVYMAYNRAIAADAARGFPSNVLCKTSHGLAFAAVGRQYSRRLGAPRIPARETARLLRINEPAKVADELAPLSPQQLARLTMQTVERFCYSADTEVDRWHVPRLAGLDQPAVWAALAAVVVPYARRAWDDIRSVDGALRFTHDCYLKLWALSNPVLPCDYVLLDEAQDSTAAVAGVVEAQTSAQRILVGDRSQAIYGWRGAVDAMATFQGRRLSLSRSFRFGAAIADEANKWLAVLDAPLRLVGHPPIASRVESLAAPAAVLCRTNGEAVRQAAAAIAAGRSAALVGGGEDIRRLAEAAVDLLAGRGTAHPDLMAFGSWAEVQDYVMQDAGGGDLKVAVKLIDDYGPAGVLAILSALVDEPRAELMLSTAHKAKGREWATVRIADDFREPRATEDHPDPQVPRDDAMLAYVAVTRAQQVLDRTGLAWVDRWVPAHLVDRPSAVAVRDDHDGRAAAQRPRAAPQVASAAAVASADWPEPVPVDEPEPPTPQEPPPVSPAAAWLHTCANPECRGDHLDPGTDCSQPGWVDRTVSGVLLGRDCRRCGHPYWECTCVLAPDRRPPVGVTV